MIRVPASYTVRMSLAGSSLVRDLVSCAHYRPDLPGREFFVDAYGRIVRAARRNDLTGLLRDSLTIARSEGLVDIEVDVSNTQFLGACLGEPPFAGGYEPDILALLAAFLPKDGVFFDVGANWGYFGLHLLLDSGFAGRVVALEPVLQSFEDLRRLRDFLDLGERLVLLRVAAGDAAAQLAISDDAWSGNQSLVGTPGSELVDVRRIDDLDLPRPALIKFDVEN